jgi:hypothetical protein
MTVLRIRIRRNHMFWASWIRIRIHMSEVRIRILPSSRKKVPKKNLTLIPTVLRLLFDFLSLKNDVNVPSLSNTQKIFLKNISWIRNTAKKTGACRVRACTRGKTSLV